MKKRALISVSDKTGIVEFAARLSALGYEIVSTGGTSAMLSNAGISVTSVSDVTKFPECLDGRLKTLHPAIHGGILAVRGDDVHMAQLALLDITPIDVVVINLYPFKKVIQKESFSNEEAIENIDIGGPAMLRAAAKNWGDVTVVTDPSDYDTVASELESGGASNETKFRLSAKVFTHTAHYDALIADYMNNLRGEKFPEYLTLTYEKAYGMRYGENPHQSAAFYREITGTAGSIAVAEQLHGKELSFNNINDANAALALLSEFSEPCAVAVKHANPCGVGVGATIHEAYMKAHNSDPVSIYGGIVALNRECDAATATELSKIFLEIIIAPSYTADALSIITHKRNIRILKLDLSENAGSGMDLKRVGGGLLLQEPDIILGDDNLNIVTKRRPTAIELDALKFCWKVVKHTRSNAIVLGTPSETIGIGPGQTNRITALELAVKYAGNNANGSVMASDAFFPFRDCVDAAAAAGVTAIIQPGGSVNDLESIKACDEHGIAMVFTGTRHFRH